MGSPAEEAEPRHYVASGLRSVSSEYDGRPIDQSIPYRTITIGNKGNVFRGNSRATRKWGSWSESGLRGWESRHEGQGSGTRPEARGREGQHGAASGHLGGIRGRQPGSRVGAGLGTRVCKGRGPVPRALLHGRYLTRRAGARRRGYLPWSNARGIGPLPS
jgi:hypothetical protein